MHKITHWIIGKLLKREGYMAFFAQKGNHYIWIKPIDHEQHSLVFSGKAIHEDGVKLSMKVESISGTR